MGSRSSMKVHPYARELDWGHMRCKNLQELRPLVPKFSDNLKNDVVAHQQQHTLSFDHKSFIRKSHTNTHQQDYDKKDYSTAAHQQVETQTGGGGTRWNPTQEQIGILETLYRGGVRTPNAQQIEQIREQLSKYGKIEGKNVFYWFQNHKARERQRQKRSILGLGLGLDLPRTPKSPPSNTPVALTFETRVEAQREEESPYKKNCRRSWSFEGLVDSKKKNNFIDQEQAHKTLELFPLHPEGESMKGRLLIN